MTTAKSERSLGYPACWLLAALLSLLVGCAGEETKGNGPKSGNGLVEYKQIVDRAQKAMEGALTSLEKVRAQSNRCPSKVFARFSKEVEHLRVESIQVRARAQAMEARGDAYFQRWHENLAQIKDPKVRQLAEQHRPELQESFARIKLITQRTRGQFRPFLDGLRTLRIGLENDPAAVCTDSTKALMQQTAESGQQVEKGLAEIRGELRSMMGMLTLAK